MLFFEKCHKKYHILGGSFQGGIIMWFQGADVQEQDASRFGLFLSYRRGSVL